MSEPEAERVQFTMAEREELLRIAAQVASNTGWTLDEAMNALITASKVGLRAAQLRAENKRLRKVADAARTFHNAWAHPLPASGAIQQEFADDLFYALETLTHPHRGEPVSEQRVSDEHLRRFIERNDGRHEGTLILGLAKDLRDARAGAAGMISKRRELPPRDRHEITMLNWFRFHPATPVTGPQHDLIRSLFRHLAAELIRSLPGGPDQTIALRKLQEAMMAANACIANNQTEDTPALNPASVDSNG